MDRMKTGRFIAELRRESGLTQEKLGERLGVTNKTISRWETGTYLPPVDVLLTMSEMFSVSINEILSGRRLSEDEYKEAAEENLTQTIRGSSFELKEKMEFFKKKWLKEHIAAMVIVGFCIIAIFVTGFILQKPVVVSIAVLLFIPAHAWRNNAMMAFAEHYAFEGNG